GGSSLYRRRKSLKALYWDPLVLNAQAQPPDVELRQPVNAVRGEGDPVVGANRARQPILAKQAIEDRAHPVSFRREQAVAREEIAGVLVGDRQRITVDPVARAEVPFEVRRPEIVGLRRGRRDDAGMLVVPPAPPLPHQPGLSQHIAR